MGVCSEDGLSGEGVCPEGVLTGGWFVLRGVCPYLW